MNNKLTQDEIESKINILTRNYEDPDRGRSHLKQFLDELRDSFQIFHYEQLQEIIRIISFNLKPLHLEVTNLKKQAINDLEQFQRRNLNNKMISSTALQAIFRGYRGSLRELQAWKTFRADTQEKFTFTISAANDHKRSADLVTNYSNFKKFCFFQRKKASELYHEALKFELSDLLEEDTEEIINKKFYLGNLEALYNNKALFTLLRLFIEKKQEKPVEISLQTARYLIAQTTLYLTNNTNYLYDKSFKEKDRVLFLQEQEKHARKSYEFADFYDGANKIVRKREEIAKEMLSSYFRSSS